MSICCLTFVLMAGIGHSPCLTWGLDTLLHEIGYLVDADELKGDSTSPKRRIGHLVTHGLAMSMGAARTAHLAYEKLGENAE